MSYRLQVQTLFQLHVDPAFRMAFRANPVHATPDLTGAEREELVKLPALGFRTHHEDTHSACGACTLSPVATGSEETATTSGEEAATAGSAFLRIGVRRRCGLAMPRTYAEVERLVKERGDRLDLDFLRTVDFWRPVPPGQGRDEIATNDAVSWTETAKVLQMSNRVYWQFYNYALSVAAREGRAPSYLAELARFEHETLTRRISLYRKFRAPGPALVSLGPQSRPRLSRYAEAAQYDYRVGEAPPAPRPCTVVFLYNAERLRILQLESDPGASLLSLDGTVPVAEFPPRVRQLLAAMASLGAVDAAEEEER
jgi:hypothetical protein